MTRHLAEFVDVRTGIDGTRTALIDRQGAWSYDQLKTLAGAFAAGLLDAGVEEGARIAVFLDKRAETVAAILGSVMARAIFVPINPVLKPRQVAHILEDSGAKVLVTTSDRLKALGTAVEDDALVETIVLVDQPAAGEGSRAHAWDGFLGESERGWRQAARVLESDIAAIFYTSGSTGLPKGVVLTNRNLVVGATSVAAYLENGPHDTILAVLPLSFDAGFSQITTGLAAGATVVLHNYLLPRDVPRACARHQVTGLTGVPPLWFQLVGADWPDEAREGLRYFANTGGHMPRPTLQKLRGLFPNASPFLMYGLTEAFRSTYLPPSEVDTRPDSIGRAIPNAEILVVKPNGDPCAPGEIGELVHRGPLVARGYWRDAERTAQRFRPAPALDARTGLPEVAVWSGDLVRKDEDGYLYFVGRNDDMIKTSGYRVSPTELEEIALGADGVAEAAAFGVSHPEKGEAILLAVVPDAEAMFDKAALEARLKRELPNFMVPEALITLDTLPRSPNGKIDRKTLNGTYHAFFDATPSDASSA